MTTEVIGTWVTIIGAFAGGAFALIQLADQAATARVHETLVYVERQNKPPFQDHFMNAKEFFNKRTDEINKRRNDFKVLSEYLVSEVENNMSPNDKEALLSFYDELQVCTCTKLCDENSVRQFFGKQASDFQGLLSPYISSQRPKLFDKTYGIGLESLGKNFRNEKLHPYCPDKSRQHS